MKTLYKFTASKKEMVKVPQESKNEDGETVVTYKEEEQAVPHYFAIRKPTRSLFDEGELFYGVRVAEGVKAGLLTNQMLSKRYMDDGGAKSEVESSFENVLYTTIVNKKLRFQELETKKDRTKEEEEELGLVKSEIVNMEHKAQKYEANQGSLFDQTAESRARDKTITWWALNLCYRKIENEDGEGFDYESFFDGDTYEEKLNSYDENEDLDDEDFKNKNLRRFLYLVGFWYIGRGTEYKDFKELEESLKEQAEIDDETKDFVNNTLAIE